MAAALEVPKKPNGSAELALSAPTPLMLLQRAMEQGVSIEQLERLQLMHERWEANEARKAFVCAMNDFKKQPPSVLKNQTASTGSYQYNYASLDNVCAAVIRGLSEHGISHRWETEQNDAGAISVTCVLTHDLGHSEKTTLRAMPDTSGGKNAIQAIGSAVTYLQRYTLLAATGLAAGGTDNDGAGAPQYRDLNERLEWIANSTNEDELRRIFSAAYKEAMYLKDKAAVNALIAAKDKRRKEL